MWQGEVTSATGAFLDRSHNRIVVHDPRWIEVPKVGCIVEIRVLCRSPYWTLVDEDDE